MARIRSIKPEFFTSPSMARLTHAQRLLYIAMWCWADDRGIGETNINGLLGFAFPDDDQMSAADLIAGCTAISSTAYCDFYQVRGRSYYIIRNWSEHQRLEGRRGTPKHPTPDDPDATPDERFAQVNAHKSMRTAISSTAYCDLPTTRSTGTGEQGNRGTGEPGNHLPQQSVEPQTARERNEPPPATPATAATPAATLVRQTIPATTPAPVQTALRIAVGELLHTGTEPDVIREALVEWADRTGIGPGLLATLAADVLKRRNGGTPRPRNAPATSKLRDIAELARQEREAENAQLETTRRKELA